LANKNVTFLASGDVVFLANNDVTFSTNKNVTFLISNIQKIKELLLIKNRFPVFQPVTESFLMETFA
jgi:hypothetical protein